MNRPTRHQLSPPSLVAHMLGTMGFSESLCSGTAHSEWRVRGRVTNPEAHSASESKADTGDSHNLCVSCKGHSEWNKKGQKESEVRVTGGAVQPSKLSGCPLLGLIRGRQDILGTWDSKTLMCVCLLVFALLSLAALLIPGFGDVKSFSHLFPCQLCSRYLQAPAHFRFR